MSDKIINVSSLFHKPVFAIVPVHILGTWHYFNEQIALMTKKFLLTYKISVKHVKLKIAGVM